MSKKRGIAPPSGGVAFHTGTSGWNFLYRGKGQGSAEAESELVCAGVATSGPMGVIHSGSRHLDHRKAHLSVTDPGFW